MAMNIDMPSDDPEEATAPPPPGREPSPPPLSPISKDDGFEDDWLDGNLAKLEQRKAEAYHKLEVQQQRWMRTARTHLNGSQYSVYDEPSTVLRVEQRLQAADDSLEEVYTDWVAARREWTLCYTYNKLKISAEKNPKLTHF